MTGSVAISFRNSVYILVVAAICTSCAKQLKPTGGDIDEVPPKILASAPENEAVNFKEREISFEFDEYIKLQAASQELVVSPPLKYPVDFKLKGKKLTISWKDTLTENTTYLFQFGEGIVDLNEGNPLDSNVFVFSTGPYLDSFSLRGNVIDAFTLKAVKDVWVMLYSQNDDSLPYLEIPRYFAKTNEQGFYELKYLSPGDYKVFALFEEGSGYLYDAPTEQIGFLEGMIASVNANDTSVTDSLYSIKLFTEIDSTQYIVGTEQVGKNGLKMQFNATVDQYLIEELTGVSDVERWSSIWNKSRDTLTFWFDAPIAYDSLRLRIVADNFSDTLLLREPKSKKARGKMSAQKSDESNISLSSKGVVNHYSQWKIKSFTPISEVRSMESFLFKEGSDTIDLTDFFSYNDTNLVIDYKWKEGQNYSLLIPDSCVYDRFGSSHDTLNFSMKTTRQEDFGSLKISYKLPDFGYPYLWQVKMGQKVVDERSIQSNGDIIYRYLNTGEYSVKLLHDENANGIWDTGYYPGKRQPEKVSFYNEKIEIRSNWETEVEWRLEL